MTGDGVLGDHQLARRSPGCSCRSRPAGGPRAAAASSRAAPRCTASRPTRSAACAAPSLDERVPGGLELQLRGVLVADAATREPDQHARPRRLVRHAQLLPRAAGATQRLQRLAGPPATRATAPAAWAASARAMALSCRSASRSSSRAAVRASSPAPVASRISTPAGSSRSGGADPRSRRARGGSRLRRPRRAPGPAAAARGRAAARSRTGSRRGRPPRRRRAHRARGGPRPGDRPRGRPDRDRAEALAGAPRLLQRHLPVARQLQDLGPVDQADAGWATISGCWPHQPASAVGPLARAPQLERPLAEGDRIAVHQAGHDRRQLARDDGHHRLVHQAQPLLHPPEPDERVTLLLDDERDEITIPEALADRGGLGRRRAHRLVVAADVGQHRRDQQVAALHALPLLALEQSLATAEPPVGARSLAMQQQLQPCPERTADRPRTAPASTCAW